MKTAIAVVSVGLAVGLAAGGANATSDAAPTVRECAKLERTASPFRGSLLAATVFCLRPSAIKTNARVTWTTCPTTPKGSGESCAEGNFSVSFRSTAASFGGGIGPLPWGPGENVPGAGLWSLPGTGAYSCKATYLDRDSGIKNDPYTKSVAVRDQAVAFAAVGKRIKVAWSVHPGERGPLGPNAAVKLGQFDTCVVVVGIGPSFARTIWPGKVISPASIQGAKTNVTSSGMSNYSFPLPESEGFLPGVRLQAVVRWTSSATIVPALKR